jgi:hypothetical protein
MRRACAAFDARLPCPALRRNPPNDAGRRITVRRSGIDRVATGGRFDVASVRGLSCAPAPPSAACGGHWPLLGAAIYTSVQMLNHVEKRATYCHNSRCAAVSQCGKRRSASQSGIRGSELRAVISGD